MNTRPITRRARLRPADYALLATLLLVSIGLLSPLFYMISFSLRTNADLSTTPGLLPARVTLYNYINMWKVAPFGLFYRNSMFMSLGTMTICVLLAAPAAYALNRFKFRGRDGISFSLVFSQVLPGIIILVPMYLLTQQLGLYNKLQGLLVVYVGLNLPFATLMLRNFFGQLPREMEEAALVDGAGRFGAFYYVALPLVRPGILAVAIVIFVGTWEEFTLALTLSNRVEVRTLPIGLSYFFQQYISDYAGLMAASVVSCVPVLLVFLALSQYFIRGISSGAVKG